MGPRPMAGLRSGRLPERVDHQLRHLRQVVPSGRGECGKHAGDQTPGVPIGLSCRRDDTRHCGGPVVGKLTETAVSRCRENHVQLIEDPLAVSRLDAKHPCVHRAADEPRRRGQAGSRHEFTILALP